MIRRFQRSFAVAAAMAVFAPPLIVAQPTRTERVPTPKLVQQNPAAALELQQDANRTREELHALLERHAPALRQVLALDPSLLSNQAFLEPYPGLSAFLAAHPEIAHNPAFYLGTGEVFHHEPGDPAIDLSKDVLGAMAAFVGVGMAIGLITWLIRTLIDYRRWSRLSKVQAEVHTKLLDRFSSNEELAAYIQSPAGAKFLESSPITLDPGPRSLGAPMGRILWSIQGGVVLVCAGLGLWFISYRVGPEAAQAIQCFGVLALALGCGFVASAIVSYGVARKLGLIDSNPHPASAEPTRV